MDTDEYYTLPEAFMSAWENCLDFMSTSSRSEFLWWELANKAITFGLMLCQVMQFGGMSTGFYRLVILLWALITAFPDSAVCVRRFRDVGAPISLLIILFLGEMFSPTEVIAMVIIIIIGSFPQDTF